jgi:hypothetical protein
VKEESPLLLERVSHFRVTLCHAEHRNARTGQPAILLREYRPQLENPARHRGAQPRHIPATHLANALHVLRPAALLATYRMPSFAHHAHEASAPSFWCHSLSKPASRKINRPIRSQPESRAKIQRISHVACVCKRLTNMRCNELYSSLLV